MLVVQNPQVGLRQAQPFFGGLRVICQQPGRRRAGELLKILHQVLIVVVARVQGHSQPVESRRSFLEAEGLVEAHNTGVELGRNAHLLPK